VILDRLLYNTASETITTLTSYLDLVYQADTIFRRLRPNYYLTGMKSNTQEPLVLLILLLSLPPVTSLIISNGGDAIDLSATSNKIVWTSNQGGKKRPKIPAKKLLVIYIIIKTTFAFSTRIPTIRSVTILLNQTNQLRKKPLALR
jgi:hypothetical protein